MQATAQAQPNIALIKYWGNQDVAANLPAVSSLSITLDSLWTRMSVEFAAAARRDRLLVNGKSDTSMLPRVSDCLDGVAGTGRPRAIVQSESNFPIAAGLASSASAFAALVVAADRASAGMRERKALARLAGASSGSAARSLYGGFVELQLRGEEIDLLDLVAAADWPLKVVVAITREAAKPVSSTEAMIRSAETSPFYSKWVEQQDSDLATAHDAVLCRDFEKLAVVSEHNCLKMHSVMWSCRPPVVYWNNATLACMQTIRDLQAQGKAVFFTIDAGPQVKAVCLPESVANVSSALQDTPGVRRVLVSGLGDGARLLEES
jgi:diphosphomevalonate decarboxylase